MADIPIWTHRKVRLKLLVGCVFFAHLFTFVHWITVLPKNSQEKSECRQENKMVQTTSDRTSDTGVLFRRHPKVPLHFIHSVLISFSD